jgi:hypothetical protein
VIACSLGANTKGDAMPAEGPPSVEMPAHAHLTDSFKKLRESAKVLKAASSELSRPVSIVNTAISELKLAITAWERISGSDDDGYGNYWSHDVGYAKVGREWGIALRTSRGNHNYPEDGDLEQWLFDDAPYSMRIDAVEHLPALVDKLIKSADKTARKVKEKAAEADVLAAELAKIVGELKRAEQEERDRRLEEQKALKKAKKP